ncbi:MAG: transposase [Candidatus Omnitrophica bacterium]|nr:transposase [Candidatus Omnitrophota bacterium]
MKRKQLRLQNYDYSIPGYYFITICTNNRQHVFGKVIVGAGPSASPRIVLNEIGLVVKSIWEQLPDCYDGVAIDEFVVMPNHVHGILTLTATGGRPQGAAPTIDLPSVVHRFKSLTAARYHKIMKQNHSSSSNKLWQRNYYERIIRNENELNEIRQYILDNPIKWEEDPENVMVNKDVALVTGDL